MTTKENRDSRCPSCLGYINLHDLCVGKGEYGEYLSEEFECPYCHAKLIADTESVDVISQE